MVESPIGVSTGIGIWVLPSDPKSNKGGRYFNLDAKTLDNVCCDKQMLL